jgi:hypothetical protein
MEKVDTRSLSPKAQERLRQLAVKAVLAGKKQVEIAKLFSVTRRRNCSAPQPSPGEFLGWLFAAPG